MVRNLKIGGEIIERGDRKKLSIKIARLYDFTEMGIPVEVVRGRKDGPTLFVDAAMHGDEINGVEICRRLLMHPCLKKINGTLIVIPIVNVFGFNDKSRYLPDRRDLNRCFPGSADGSLGSQIAHIFMNEIVEKSTHGIDLHTGAWHRTNLPQIRANINDAETLRLAKCFNAPVIINSSVRDGSLRAAAAELKLPMLLYEGGEALRFDEKVINLGIKGIISFMQNIGMLNLPKASATRECKSFIARSSHWIRAPHSGILLVRKKLGDKVKKGEMLAVISNPFGEHRFEVRAVRDGIVIGQTHLPLANEGDALYHIATFEEYGKSDDRGQENLEIIDPINMSVG